MGYYLPPFKKNWVGQATLLTQSKEAEDAAKATMVTTPMHQAVASFTFMQPATAPAMQSKSLVTISNQISPSYCATCTPLRKQCPTTYPMPINWSESNEEEKDLKVPDEAEEIIDWDGDIQK